jgi:hypothetical protein
MASAAKVCFQRSRNTKSHSKGGHDKKQSPCAATLVLRTRDQRLLFGVVKVIGSGAALGSKPTSEPARLAQCQSLMGGKRRTLNTVIYAI